MTLRDQLQSALGSAFTIDRELTGGGMSRVFVATENALGRRVVVKVLHPELAADVTAERFSREIQLVARLQQANIVPLLTTGHTGEVPFYTMPFVDGESLRHRLASGAPMPLPEVIGILRDVARALAYAHDAGIVHRDIKPENVLLSGGAAVVTDFGIAKAISASRTQQGDSRAATITQAGAGIGTPAYMAPEQAAGDPAVDHRIDIYAFGCLAYELLAGHPPFVAPAVHEVVAAHISKTPVAIATLRRDTPPTLARLVMRCLEKQPGQRPQSARELLEGLDSAATPTAPGRFAAGGRPRTLALVGGTLAALVVVALLLARRGTDDAQRAGPPSIAVIPFANVNGDSAHDYLADGLSDELATSVGKMSGVRLASRTGAYRYRGRRDLDVREVGRTLSVGYVLQGTVRQAGDQLRVSAQLTDANTGVELWADAFDRTAKDIFRTQDEIVMAVGRALAAHGVGRGATAVVASAATKGTTNTDAYDLYLRAEYLLLHRRVDRAAQTFDSAIVLDPQYWRAYAGLAKSLSLMPYFTGTGVREIAPRLRAAAGKALAADSTIAEAHTALGMLATEENKWDEARAEFERAVATDPTDVENHFQFGRYWLYVGNDANAYAEWTRARLRLHDGRGAAARIAGLCDRGAVCPRAGTRDAHAVGAAVGGHADPDARARR